MTLLNLRLVHEGMRVDPKTYVLILRFPERLLLVLVVIDDAGIVLLEQEIQRYSSEDVHEACEVGRRCVHVHRQASKQLDSRIGERCEEELECRSDGVAQCLTARDVSNRFRSVTDSASRRRVGSQ